MGQLEFVLLKDCPVARFTRSGSTYYVEPNGIIWLGCIDPRATERELRLKRVLSRAGMEILECWGQALAEANATELAT